VASVQNGVAPQPNELQSQFQHQTNSELPTVSKGTPITPN